MKKVEFVAFLLEANRAGYADPDAKIIDCPDGGHEIVYTKDNVTFSDYWYGGNPFAGQEAVTVDGKTIWAMQYRGGVPKKYEKKEAEIFSFLKEALAQCSTDEPLRGPAEFIRGDWRYMNSWNHNLAEFSGHEEVTYRGEVVHITDYMGGLVDGSKWEDDHGE